MEQIAKARLPCLHHDSLASPSCCLFRYYADMLKESPCGEVSHMQFTLSSHSFKAMLQFLYTGFIKGACWVSLVLSCPSCRASDRNFAQHHCPRASLLHDAALCMCANAPASTHRAHRNASRPGPAHQARAPAELEQHSIDEYLDYVAPLYRRSLMERYGRLGGLDDYLTVRFVNRDPETFAAALKRLRMAWEHAADLAAASPPEPASQHEKVQVCAALASLIAHAGSVCAPAARPLPVCLPKCAPPVCMPSPRLCASCCVCVPAHLMLTAPLATAR